MLDPTGQLERFVRRVHRRLTIIRLLERVGVCLVVGCAADLLLAPILMWRGESALPMILFTFAAGAAAGIAWGWARRPKMLDAASEADRQLDLADLLGTALSSP